MDLRLKVVLELDRTEAKALLGDLELLTDVELSAVGQAFRDFLAEFLGTGR